MSRLRLALSVALSGALVVAACETEEARWTPLPPASPTAPASPADGASPGATAGGEVEVVIGTDEGTRNEFVPSEAEVATGAQVTLIFENVATVPHNLTFGPPIDQGTATIVQPGASETLDFTALEPGDYQFVCTIHPGMEGVLHVTE